MGVLDRLGLGKGFEKKKYLSPMDISVIDSEFSKVYKNIMNGYMTRSQGKEYMLDYVTELLKKKYPGINFEKSGLAGKINRYVSAKFRNVDGTSLGEAKRSGRIEDIRQDLRGKLKSMIDGRINQAKDYKKKSKSRSSVSDIYDKLFKPNEDEVKIFLKNYLKSEKWKFRRQKWENLNFSSLGSLADEVAQEYMNDPGNFEGAKGAESLKDVLLPHGWDEKYETQKIKRSNVNVKKFMEEEKREKVEVETAAKIASGIAPYAMEKYRDEIQDWSNLTKKRRAEISKDLMKQLQSIWDAVIKY